MFVSQERGATRKSFQKPNILRRKSKTVRLNAQISNESPEIMTSVSTTSGDSRIVPSPGHMQKSGGECSQTLQLAQAPKMSVVEISEIYRENESDISQTLDVNGDSITIYAHAARADNNATSGAHDMLNVESFLNEGVIKQNNILFNIDSTLRSKIETETKQKWCLDFMGDDSKYAVTTDYYDGSQLNNIYIDKSSDISMDAAAVPLAVVSLLNRETNTSQEVVTVPAQKLALNGPSETCRVVKFKCEVPNCNKEFWTEALLQKHKNIHNKRKSTLTVIECPVKKPDAEGVEVRCGRTFPVRDELTKHLNEEHSPEDALYRCPKCSRRFFWAGGMRSHLAGSCVVSLACTWPGCGRVFRQPCRLREHARAHTGDRPYPCSYPNCGWAFRSASKLVRHARRHTGERRHACSECGRAFLRREHLRDHVARHHAPRAAASLHCTHAGCEQTFNNMSSLYMHMKRVHKNNEGNKTSPPKRAQKNTKAKKDMFVVSLGTETPNITDVEASATITTEEQILQSIDATTINVITDADVATDADDATDVGVTTDTDATADTDVAMGLEGRCARTHCTWPLQRPQQQHYALEEDTQVEQSESSESNIFTVRSDLFLHGNVLINEDSEFIISRASSVGGAGVEENGDDEDGGEADNRGAGGGQLDALGLIDSHPTIDLMQEELMYADAAVDESSFRVFLLNGEELT